MSSWGDAGAVALKGTSSDQPEKHRGRTGSRLRQKDCHQALGKGERADRRDDLRGGRRPGGGTRSISEIPAGSS
jgi:hypothetical protein